MQLLLIKRCFLLIFLVGVMFPLAFARSQTSEVQVIVNSSVQPVDMRVDQIRRIFSMRQTEWSNNQVITVFVLARQHKTHQMFSTKVLGVFPYQLERIWDKLVYSGLGEQPIQVNSEQEMLELISKKSGSIGYVLHGVENDNVKIVNVVKE